ncbi:argonaute-binding protein 1 [Aspergillus udagawae]|nr:argonaute-binding protein 1 [Aspergillus udagawae]
MESPEIPSDSSHELPLSPLKQYNSPRSEQLNTATSTEPPTSKPIEMTPPQSEANDSQEKLESVPVNMVESKKEKKKTTRPKSKRGKNKPTGFEEYYVDAPITPQEYAEGREIYDVSRPIIHRMEDAILRFQKKRRIECDRREIFLKYLQYGGVDISQKMFTGTDQRDLKEMDSEDILLARAQTSIAQEQLNLQIDFNAVVKGFLTSYFPYYFNPETEDMVKLATVTIWNFLTYILYHDVVPEYKANVEEARKSCDIASKELWKNQQFTAKGPGDFNTACSTLFGGVFFDLHVEVDQWNNSKDHAVHMTNEIARKVVKFALAGAGVDRQAVRFQELANQDALRAMRVEDIDGFEVTAIIFPDDETREFYKVHATDLRPVGRMLAKAYRDPGKPNIDLSPEERLQWEAGGAPALEFDFFLEEGLLKLCYPGMKVITSVWELNCGTHYFDEVFTAYCSIYTALANDLMIGWKKPKDFRMGDNHEADETDDEEGKDPKEKGVEGDHAVEPRI